MISSSPGAPTHSRRATGDESEDFSPGPTQDTNNQDAGFQPFDGEQTIENQPFDEAVALTDESSVSDDDSEEFNQTGELHRCTDDSSESLIVPPGDRDRPNDEFGDNAMLVTNQSYDEAIDVSEASHVTSQASPNGGMS